MVSFGTIKSRLRRDFLLPFVRTSRTTFVSMSKPFKPGGYNSVSPYFIVNGAQRFIDLMKRVFDAKELRRFDMPDGTIMHAELQIDDSVIMLGDASEKWPPVPIVMHVYVSNVDETFQKAIDAGCAIMEKPAVKEGDPDKRGSFKDFWGNIWSLGTQQ
jgi:PhnB protein